MPAKTTEPKRHADHITETVQITDRIKRSYSDKLKQHAVWVDGEIVAASHSVNIMWSIVIGNPDNASPDIQTTKFGGLAPSEADAIATLIKIAHKLAAA